jgi:protein TonB
VEILAADPPGVFDDAVRRGALNWRFEPGRIAGTPVDTWVITTVSFRVNR